MSRTGRQTDNSEVRNKIAMRRRYTGKDSRVLDLFCGTGKMYHNAYRGRVADYKGVDRKTVHDEELCVLQNNETFVRQNDISEYNVFDLDAYGSPWKLLYLIAEKLKPGEYTFFITDGLALRLRLSQHATRFVSATNQIPKGMKINGLNLFYVDMFGTALKQIEERYKIKITTAEYTKNHRNTVYYWVIKAERL